MPLPLVPFLSRLIDYKGRGHEQQATEDCGADGSTLQTVCLLGSTACSLELGCQRFGARGFVHWGYQWTNVIRQAAIGFLRNGEMRGGDHLAIAVGMKLD